MLGIEDTISTKSPALFNNQRSCFDITHEFDYENKKIRTTSLFAVDGDAGCGIRCGSNGALLGLNNLHGVSVCLVGGIQMRA